MVVFITKSDDILREESSFLNNEGEGKGMTIYDFKNSCPKTVFLFFP